MVVSRGGSLRFVLCLSAVRFCILFWLPLIHRSFVCRVRCTVYGVRCTVYGTVYDVRCTICSRHIRLVPATALVSYADRRSRGGSERWRWGWGCERDDSESIAFIDSSDTKKEFGRGIGFSHYTQFTGAVAVRCVHPCTRLQSLHFMRC